MEKSEVIYLDTSSVLISTRAKLLRVTCPFKVVAIMKIDDIPSGEVKTVWAVYPSTIHKLLYLIDNKKFIYSYFQVSS